MASKKSIAIYWAWHLMWNGGQCESIYCKCPFGKSFFAEKGPWIPSADRWPIPGCRGGTYELNNIRLVHQTCNKIEGGQMGGSVKSIAQQQASRENWAKISIESLKSAGNNINSRNLTHRDHVRGGEIGRCSRWHINRGKPCICGAHDKITTIKGNK